MSRFLRWIVSTSCIRQFVFLTALVHLANCYSAPPTLEYVFPIAFARGTKESVTLGGKFEPWPVTVWTDCPGLTFSATTNSGKMSVEISNDAPIGPHLLRIYNSDGASALRIFVISSLKDVSETEPNDSIKQAQLIDKLPVTIGGRLEKSGDVDFFSLKLEADKWFVAKVDAFSLGSPVDAALHLLNAQGIRIAFCHDDGPRLDPVLAYRVESSGTYFLEIAGFVNPPAADVRYAGSPATIYRLAVTQGPFIKHLFPPGVQRGKKRSLQPLGWNLNTSAPDEVFDAAANGSDIEATFVSVATPESRIPIAIGNWDEVTETEPNDAATNAQSILLPCVVNGRIDSSGDTDRFQFSAKKGDSVHLRLSSASLGFSLEPLLRIEDSAGQQLAPEDRGSTESNLTWTPPTNGTYIVAVSDLFHRGGDDYAYRLAIGPPKPDFKAVAAQDAIRVVVGETNELKIQITRLDNYTNALAILVEGLPMDVTAKPPELPAKSGEITLPFVASAEAMPTNQPIRILIRSTHGDGLKSHPVTCDLRGKESPSERLINETDQIWLTVAPKPPPPAEKPPEKK